MNMERMMMARTNALLKVAIVFAMVFTSHIGFPYKFILITIIVFGLTYNEDRTLKTIGFNNRFSVKQIFLISALLFLVLEPLFDFLIQPLVNLITAETPNYSTFSIVRGNFTNYLKYLLFIWLSAAIGEEVVFRGFMFRQLKIIFPKFRFRTTFIVLTTAILFAIPHFYLGASGAILTFLFGVVFGSVYVLFRCNIWIVILLHGFVDSFFITLSYLDKMEYFEMMNALIFGY